VNSISYWVPEELRELYESETVLDADNAGLKERETLGDIKQGIATADDSRFVHQFWENTDTTCLGTICKKRRRLLDSSAS